MYGDFLSGNTINLNFISNIKLCNLCVKLLFSVVKNKPQRKQSSHRKNGKSRNRI